MSVMQPKGHPIELEGVQHRLLFTLAAVDEVQDHYDEAMIEVLARLRDDRAVISTTGYIMTVLLNDEAARTGGQPVTEEEVKRMISIENLEDCVRTILQAYGLSVPELEDDDPNPESRSNSTLPG